MNILYEDSDLLVVEKPAGIPVESRKIGVPDMNSLLKNYLASQSLNHPPYLGMIHRLDQPVQGVMAFAKTPRAAKTLSLDLANGSMTKHYLAVVTGIPPEEGELTDFLRKDGRTNTSAIVPKGTPGAKLARLTYRRISVLPSESLSLVQIHLLTGRHHQIRVQMAGAGFPLYGDRKYNPSPGQAGEGLYFRSP